ncbi:MAG: lipid-A-disaccharide synthase [Candidatus Omnitrophica bacterium]|nr:lipid-A-disaccharide synthase [Candidatus Omnitrophota bacterium]
MPSVCFVAGDPSGDIQAARLIETLKRRLPGLTVTALGGAAMRRAGAVLLDDLTHTASIGPFDAARHLARFIRAKRLLDDHLRRQPPTLVILVDFGDFNLPVIAPLVKRHGIPILYYISPQVWAWGRWRLRYVRRYVDRMVVFFPFEEALYRREGIPVTWVGHPLVDQARPSLSKEAALQHFGLNPWRRTVGLLPGSRDHEIARHLPLMLSAAARIAWRMPGVQFLLPRAPTVPEGLVRQHVLRACVDVRIAEGSIYDALQLMDAALVASGTATLDTALCGVPMVVVYRASWPTYVAARAVIRVPHIALVNVVAERKVVPELIQYRATPARVAGALVKLLRDEERCASMKEALREVKARLGPAGAIERAARVVREMLAQKSDVR